jgi:hypothetical protein
MMAATNLVTARIEKCTQINYVWVFDKPHNLQFAVLGTRIGGLEGGNMTTWGQTLKRLSCKTFLIAMSSKCLGTPSWRA